MLSLNFPLSNRRSATMVQATIAFLQQWMANNDNQVLRHDYHELATLTLMFLSNSMIEKNDIRVKAPGALYNVRWIAKALYTLKITIYRDQLQDVYS